MRVSYSGIGGYTGEYHWQVDDKATSSLMAYFYEELAKGISKDEALQQAKLRYLESANPITANPFFWGSAVTIGDAKPVVSNTWYYCLIGGIAWKKVR